ncbi:hypothetical protein BH20ACI1_BH20ACI1_16210 [soil metagenome]
MNQKEQKFSNIIAEVENLYNQLSNYTDFPEVREVFGLDKNSHFNDEKFIKILLFCLISESGRTFDLLDYFGFDRMEEYISILCNKGFLNLYNNPSLHYSSKITVSEFKNKIKEAIDSEAKFKLELSKKLNEFLTVDEYKYVSQFTKRFGEEAEITELEKLRKILEIRKWNFSLRELKTMILLEVTKQNNQKIKSKLLLNEPQTKKDILNSYLNFYEKDDEKMLEILASILKERGFIVSAINDLKAELSNLCDEIELFHFEQQLLKSEERLKIEDIDLLDGYQFEDFLKDLYLKMGYEVEPTKLSGDQGADLVVVKFGEKTVIQAKCYSGKVGNKAIQEILASMSLYKAQKGSVITNNYYTPAAFELADANNIKLIDRDSLEQLIKKYW